MLYIHKDKVAEDMANEIYRQEPLLKGFYEYGDGFDDFMSDFLWDRYFNKYVRLDYKTREEPSTSHLDKEILEQAFVTFRRRYYAYFLEDLDTYCSKLDDEEIRPVAEKLLKKYHLTESVVKRLRDSIDATVGEHILEEVYENFDEDSYQLRKRFYVAVWYVLNRVINVNKLAKVFAESVIKNAEDLEKKR